MVGFERLSAAAVDQEVGQRIRVLRHVRGLSQAALGRAVGLSFQQIQKYERAQNRVSAGQLYAIARALNAPVDAFFDTMPRTASEDPLPELLDRRTVRLIRAYHRIEDHVLRHQLAQLIQSFGASRRLDEI